MKPSFSLLTSACLMVAATASADTFVMKNGDRLDAKILKETADSYVLDVQITKSIRDEKTVAKADVAEILAEKTDEKTFEKIKGVVPTADLLGNDEYDKRIVAVVTFIKDNPKSPLVAEAEQMLATLKAEGVVVMGGGMKLGGKMISADEYKADAYDVDARITEKRVRDAADRGDLLSALRGISRLESDYRLTTSRRSLVPLKKQLLNAYKVQIDEQLSTFDSRTEERKAGLARMAGEARVASEQALKEELETTEQLIAAEQAKQQKWITTHPFNKKSLAATQNEIDDQLGETIQDNGRDAGKMYRNALRMIGETDDQAVIRDIVDKITELELPAKYADRITDAAKAKGVTL